MNNSKIQKRAFSLVESIMVMSMLAVIISISIPVFIQKSVNTKLYYSTFKAFKKITGEIITDSTNKEIAAGAGVYCDAFANVINNVELDLDGDGTVEIDDVSGPTTRDDMGCLSSQWRDDGAYKERPNIILSNGVRLYGMEHDYSTDGDCAIFQMDIDGNFDNEDANSEDNDIFGIRVCKNGFVSAESTIEEAILSKYSSESEKEAWGVGTCTLTADGVDDFVDTEVISGPDVKVEIKGRFVKEDPSLDNVGAKIFGYNEQDKHFFIGQKDDSGYHFYYGAGNSPTDVDTTTVDYDNKLHVFTLDATSDRALIDHQDVKDSTNFATGGNIYLFAQNAAGTDQLHSNFELHYAKIWYWDTATSKHMYKYYYPACSSSSGQLRMERIDLTKKGNEIGYMASGPATLSNFDTSTAFKRLINEL